MKKAALFFSFLALITSFIVLIWGQKIPYINIASPLYLHLGLICTLAGLSFCLRRGTVALTLIAFLLGTSFCLLHLEFAFAYFFLGVFLSTRQQLQLNFPIKKTLHTLMSLFQKRSFETIFFVVLIALLVISFYHQTFQLYFQSDEWPYFRDYLPAISSTIWPVVGVVHAFTQTRQLGFHMSPLLEVIYVWTFRLFGLQYLFYITIYLLLHICNSYLFYVFAKKLSGRRALAAVATAFFAVSVAHHQAFTWVAAAPGTLLAVTWMLCALIQVLKYRQDGSATSLRKVMFFLFLGLMTKETSLMLIPLITVSCWKTSENFIRNLTKLWGMWLSFALFAGIRIFFSSDSTSLVTTVQKDFPLLVFRSSVFSLKGFSQTVLSQKTITDIAVWMADMQFPFFNLEKSVRGSTYLNFIQGAAFEFISYFFTVVFFLFLSVAQVTRKLFTWSLGIFLCGVLPLVTITFIFPWWGYTSQLDSRHLYHLSLGTALLFGFAVVKSAEWLSTFLHRDHRVTHVYAVVLMSMWLSWQYGLVQESLSHFTQEALQRKAIITTLTRQVATPPKKMIIYTTSNKSYYGFGEWMLPFQTPFAHMLPVLFAKQYNKNGLDYPKNFYTREYLPTGGLITQGYYEKDGYGLGYFLDKVPIIKLLEKNNYPSDMVYAFDFDGDHSQLIDRTDTMRHEFEKILSSRKEFFNWKEYGSQEERILFAVNPDWRVEKQGHMYKISSTARQLMNISVYQNELNEPFSSFVSKQKVGVKVIGNDYITTNLYPDLDTSRVRYSPKEIPQVSFTLAGNNLTFYKLEVYDADNAAKIMRTFEFADQEQEKLEYN